MKLSSEQKFILPDDDGNLILITEVNFDINILQNRIIPMKGIKFNVDYNKNEIENGEIVDVQTSFTIDGVYDKEEL